MLKQFCILNFPVCAVIIIEDFDVAVDDLTLNSSKRTIQISITKTLLNKIGYLKGAYQFKTLIIRNQDTTLKKI